jgi:hypothetical protein
MRRLIAFALGGVLALGVVGPASADAIDCPPGQTSVHTSDAGWFCQNNGGNPDNSEKPKHGRILGSPVLAIMADPDRFYQDVDPIGGVPDPPGPEQDPGTVSSDPQPSD